MLKRVGAWGPVLLLAALSVALSVVLGVGRRVARGVRGRGGDASAWPRAGVAGAWRMAAPALWALATVVAPAAAAPVAVPDTLAQRLVACTACHGAEGRATNAGYFPRIAGKPADYLYRQLQHFRDGRRQNATMAALLQNLNDAYLYEIAGHFAALALPYPPPRPATSPPAVLARGEGLVRHGDARRGLPACVACHGAALTGMLPAVPALLGLPQDYLLVQFGTWRSGLRHADAPDCMAQIAQRLDPQDVAALAAWLAAQPVPADARPAPAQPGPWPLACGSMAAPAPRPAGRP